MLRRQATCRGPATHSPMAARNVLAGAPIAIRLIGTAARAIGIVIYRALACAMGAEPALTWSAAAECVLLCAFAGRLRDVLRLCAPSRRLSTSTARPTLGGVRLVRGGDRCVERNRAIGASLCASVSVTFFELVHASARECVRLCA